MLNRVRDKFGTAGLLVAVVALVAALSGSAVAANGGGSGDATASASKGGGNVNKLIKRESRKFSKRFSAAFSKRFAIPGPPGVPGLVGPQGVPGDDGDDGSDGSDGADGSDGKSVVTGNATFSECNQGGATVEVEGTPTSKKKICNGKEGDPWTAGGTLPEGETETGAWAGFASLGSKKIWTPISFTIPLSEPLEGSEVHFFEELDFGTTCTGTAADPTAPAGHLCVYGTMISLEGGPFGAIVDPAIFASAGASTSGAAINLVLKEDVAGIEEGFGFGTWAVTAPIES